MEATSAPHPRALRLPRPRRLLAAQSDERLVDHVRNGDEGAFEVLYDRHSGGILGFCRHMLGNVADAEDAVQHTFIAAHADIERHERRDLHVKAWLYTIARNRCLSMLRARREHPTADQLDVVTDNLARDLEHREDVRALLSDVTKLPDDQREALVLAEVGDLSHSDIGRILGCEASKVKSLVFQARTALIDRRIARETPCEEIREQLATLRGGALRRSHLRHHLEACPGCSEYRDEIRRQRAMLAVALPVVPSAVLKAKVLGGIGFGGGSAAAAATGGAAATAAAGGFGLAPAGGLAKLGIVVALAVGGAGTATVASHGNIPLLHDSSAVKPAPASTHGAASNSAAHTGRTTTPVSTNAAAAIKHKTDGSRRSASGTEHGFTPITGQSNGDRARAFAQTRGKGKEISASHRHSTAHSRAHRVSPAHVKHVATPRRTRPNQTDSTTAPRSSTPSTITTPPSSSAPTTTQPAPRQQQPTTTTPAPSSGSTRGGNTGHAGGTAGSTTTIGG